MYNIYKRDNKWLVMYQDRENTWEITAMCQSPEIAAEVCSWLNGGSKPDRLIDVEWVGN